MLRIRTILHSLQRLGPVDVVEMLNRPGNDSVAATVDGGRMYAAAADLSIVSGRDGLQRARIAPIALIPNAYPNPPSTLISRHSGGPGSTRTLLFVGLGATSPIKMASTGF